MTQVTNVGYVSTMGSPCCICGEPGIVCISGGDSMTSVNELGQTVTVLEAKRLWYCSLHMDKAQIVTTGETPCQAP